MKDLICSTCGEPTDAISIDYGIVCDTCYDILDSMWDLRILSSLPVDSIDRKYHLSHGRHRRENSLTG